MNAPMRVTPRDFIVAEWREQGADTVMVTAEWRNSSLVFTDARQGRQGHYDVSYTEKSLHIIN
jgi:hypothetical protein